MNLYRSKGRIWTGTQADARAANDGNKDFEHIDVPTSKAELIDFLNQMEERVGAGHMAASEPVEELGYHPASEEEAQRGLNDVWPGDPVPDRPYRNGDPTTPYLKSRDPAARKTCLSCGGIDERTVMAMNPDDLDKLIALATARRIVLDAE